jgi:hypothetical protein
MRRESGSNYSLTPMQSSTSDPWEDEGFGGEDDWAGTESLETDVEDEDETEDDLEPGELEDEPDLADEV